MRCPVRWTIEKVEGPSPMGQEDAAREASDLGVRRHLRLTLNSPHPGGVVCGDKAGDVRAPRRMARRPYLRHLAPYLHRWQGQLLYIGGATGTHSDCKSPLGTPTALHHSTK